MSLIQTSCWDFVKQDTCAVMGGFTGISSVCDHFQRSTRGNISTCRTYCARINNIPTPHQITCMGFLFWQTFSRKIFPQLEQTVRDRQTADWSCRRKQLEDYEGNTSSNTTQHELGSVCVCVCVCNTAFSVTWIWRLTLSIVFNSFPR